MAKEFCVSLRAFKFLCGDADEICRLCLGSTDGQTKVHIGDAAVIQRPYCEESVTYLDILEELSVPTDECLPENLCSTCTDTITNAYVFRRLCDYSYNKWVEVVNRLNTSLNLTESVSPTVKSVYLLVNDSSCDIFTSRTSDPKIKKNVIIKIQNIVKSRKSYAKTKSKHLKAIKCKECNKEFKFNSQLSYHKAKVHIKTSSTCPQCLKVFVTPRQMEYHAERVHYPKKISCPLCAKRFSTHRLLKIHDKYHHKEAVCKLCSQKFQSKQLLTAHLDKHKVNNCPRCDKSFGNIHTYRAHLKICGTSKEKRPRFFCDICKKGYVNKNGVRSHLIIDHGFGNALTCKWCKKKYDAISKLKNHMVKHTRERNFRCEHCGNSFVTKSALIYHVRLHTGERPFPCELCDESFLSASRRMEHKRSKHFVPTNQCPLCPMKFASSSVLKKHTERHKNPNSKLYCPSIGEMQPLIISYR